MHFAAIVERRLPHWYVYIPALTTGGLVPKRDDVHSGALALAAAATGLPPAAVRVQLHSAEPGDTVVLCVPADVETRHNDGVWRTARHTGWVRQWNGSWWLLVAYEADGATWTRAVRSASVRPSGAEVSAAAPAPRTGAEPERLAHVGRG